jgi:hypothetical protein
MSRITSMIFCDDDISFSLIAANPSMERLFLEEKKTKFNANLDVVNREGKVSRRSRKMETTRRK